MLLNVRGEGEPLVLIHGLATTSVIWRRVVPLLGDGRRIVTLDVPGFGDSPAVGYGFELDEVASAIEDGLERAGVDGSYDLVGHSMGGAIAMKLAERSPQRVRRLVLAAPAGLRPMSPTAARAAGAFARRAVPLRRRGAGLADTSWGRWLLMTPGTAEPHTIPPGEVRAMLAASEKATRIGEALATVASTDLRPLLATLPVPVGGVWGTRDRIVPPGGAHTLRALRPEAPTRSIQRAGHIPMMERPQDFADALDEVLTALSHDGNK